MRHGFRGSRRKRLPGTNSIKYIVNIAGASEPAGLSAVTMALGTDLITGGQSAPTVAAVKTGSKIALFDIRMPKVSLSATANFIHWSIQRVLSGQSVINPIIMGGDPLRKNVMLSGVLGLGEGQNNQLHIRYKVPPKFQRIGDGDAWILVNNNTGAVSTIYQIMYKVWS